MTLHGYEHVALVPRSYKYQHEAQIPVNTLYQHVMFINTSIVIQVNKINYFDTNGIPYIAS